ncbi:hypothetical protein [Pontibacter roseus]|uniref:hypothetical protein n=1 Tax=Pontibacter roseus TaxID=336989 RepID=UPI0003A9880F|nr:hypothetical protein [Pontibacter roseus]
MVATETGVYLLTLSVRAWVYPLYLADPPHKNETTALKTKGWNPRPATSKA